VKTKVSGLQKKAGRFHRFLGIRASLTYITIGLLSISLILVLYSVHTLNNMRAAMIMLASQDLSGLVIAQQISNDYIFLNDELQGISFISEDKERQQEMAKINHIVKRLRGELQLINGMGKAAHNDAQQAAARDLEREMAREMEQLDKFIKRYDQTLGRLITIANALETRREHIDQVYAVFVAACEDVNRQMRAFVSRSLAVNIPDAASQKRLDQELDAFLEREMSWLGTAQDLRNDGRELITISEAVSTETDPAALDMFTRQAAALSLRLSLYKRLPTTEATQNLAVRINELNSQFAGNHAPTLFSIRKTEITLEKQLQTQYDEIIELSRHLQQDAVKMEVMQGNMAQWTVQKANSDVHRAKLFLIVFSLTAMLLSFFTLYYVVGARIIKRIEGLTEYMQRSALAAERGQYGPLDKKIRKVIGSGNDEIAAMGRAFIVFVDAILTEKGFSEAAISSLPGIFYMYDRQGRLVYWNGNAETILGYEPAEIAAANIMAFVAEEDQARVQSAVEKVFTTGYGDVEAELITKNGVPIPYYLNGVRMTRNDTVYVIGTGLDMTQLKKSAEELRESEGRFKNLYQGSPIPTFTWQKRGDDFTLIDFNNAAIQISNRQVCDHLGDSALALYKERPQILSDMKLCFQERSVLRRELTSQNFAPGKHLFVYYAFIPPDLVIVLGEDQTDRKQAEENFRRSLDESPLGVRIVSADGETIYTNRALLDIYAYEGIEELQATSAKERYTPESYAEFRTRREKRQKGDALPAEYEISIVRKDGEVRRLLAFRKEIIWNGTVQFQVLYNDITERKRAEDNLQRTLQNLRESFGTTVQVLVAAVETRDPYTSGHQIRSADLARAIAAEMGLPQERIDGIRMAGSIHDIGKISVPAEILSKPTKLTELEFSLIKEHADKGYELLRDVASPWPLAEIVYQHHERMDGSGYPRHLKGEKILMEARILSVADVVESMASHRPYRPAIGLDAALAEIENNKGTLYDADVVDACLILFREKGFQLEKT